jgi:hypothetical protein
LACVCRRSLRSGRAGAGQRNSLGQEVEEGFGPLRTRRGQRAEYLPNLRAGFRFVPAGDFPRDDRRT